MGVEIQVQLCAEDEEHGMMFVAYKIEKPELPYVYKKHTGQFSNNASCDSGRIDIKFSCWLLGVMHHHDLGMDTNFLTKIITATIEMRLMLLIQNKDEAKVS